jgi:hypothetical protein
MPSMGIPSSRSARTAGIGEGAADQRYQVASAVTVRAGRRSKARPRESWSGAEVVAAGEARERRTPQELGVDGDASCDVEVEREGAAPDERGAQARMRLEPEPEDRGGAGGKLDVDPRRGALGRRVVGPIEVERHVQVGAGAAGVGEDRHARAQGEPRKRPPRQRRMDGDAVQSVVVLDESRKGGRSGVDADHPLVGEVEGDAEGQGRALDLARDREPERHPAGGLGGGAAAVEGETRNPEAVPGEKADPIAEGDSRRVVVGGGGVVGERRKCAGEGGAATTEAVHVEGVRSGGAGREEREEEWERALHWK